MENKDIYIYNDIYNANTMAADGPAMQGARASTVSYGIDIFPNIQTSAPNGLYESSTV